MFVTRSDTGSIPVVSAVGDVGGYANADALMSLPGEVGAVAKIREQNYPNGTRQEIALVGDKLTTGENVIDVSIQTSTRSDGLGGGLRIGKPSEQGIRSEILSRFPDVRMGIVTRPMRNAYGVFGIAIGKHANGARCLFAWQWIDDIRDVAQGGSGFSRLGSLISNSGTPVSIRIRLCRGDQTADQLASVVEGLQFGEASAVNRVLTMDRRNLPSVATSATLSTGGAGVASMPQSLEAAISGPNPQPKPQVAARPAAPRRVAARPAPKPRRVARSKPEPDTAAEAVVPPTPIGPSIPQQSLVAPGAAAMPIVTGPRYLAPVGGAPAGGGYTPGAAAPQTRIESSLPPQAFRGPTTAMPPMR
jgi:hypothetical protein